MSAYTSNRNCQCPRCRAKGLMGAAILVTLGILFLLRNFGVVGFGESFPVLLIVIGVFLYLGQSVSTEGHVEAYRVAGPVPPPPPPAAGDQHGPEVNP